jgi:hypothetical protein
MTDARQFLIDDIAALMQHDKPPEWLNSVSIEGLYRLWQDLVNLSTMEAIA